MNGTPLQSALRELQTLYSSRIAWAIMGGLSLVLGLSGPFGTFDDFPLLNRFIYWGAIVVSTYAVGIGVGRLVAEGLRYRIHLHWPLVVLAGAAGGPPVTAVVMLINLLAYGHADAMAPLMLLVDCTVIAIGVAVLGELVTGKRPDPVTPESHPLAQSPPILERLPHPLRGRLVALSVTDHYVEVRTEKGRSLLLMRLSDAIRETAPVEGPQIHRSHWVALDAVRQVRKSAGKVSVELVTGESLPVSRGFLPSVKEAGLVV